MRVMLHVTLNPSTLLHVIGFFGILWDSSVVKLAVKISIVRSKIVACHSLIWRMLSGSWRFLGNGGILGRMLLQNTAGQRLIFWFDDWNILMRFMGELQGFGTEGFDEFFFWSFLAILFGMPTRFLGFFSSWSVTEYPDGLIFKKNKLKWTFLSWYLPLMQVFGIISESSAATSSCGIVLGFLSLGARLVARLMVPKRHATTGILSGILNYFVNKIFTDSVGNRPDHIIGVLSGSSRTLLRMFS